MPDLAHLRATAVAGVDDDETVLARLRVPPAWLEGLSLAIVCADLATAVGATIARHALTASDLVADRISTTASTP